MNARDKELEEIVRALAAKFPSFGGGKDSDTNPIAHALKNRPAMFAAGVDIEKVVRFVLASTRTKN